MTWLEEALQLIQQNRWTAPLYIVGAWPDATREAAALSLIRALGANRSTRTFILQNAALNAEKDEAITTTLRENTSLKSVTLRNLSTENEGERYSVPAELFTSRSIASVSLTRCRLDLRACQALGKAIRDGNRLTNLYLNDVDFDPAGQMVFLASMCMAHALKSLTVRDLHWTNQDTRRFLTILATNKSIESLNIERMSTEEGFERDIAFLCSRNRTIRTLSIRENGLEGSAIQHICTQGLVHNKGLERVYISHNPIGVEGVQAMMDLLKESSNIKDVCFALTHLGPEGCRVVAKNLPDCVHLERINLDGNRIDDCGQDFLEALQKNFNVVSLFDCLPKLIMKGLSPHLSAWKEVDLLLRCNKAKRRFFQNAEEHSDAVVPVVLASASAEPDVLFHFVKNLGRPVQTSNKSTMVVPPAPRRPSMVSYVGIKAAPSKQPRLVQRVSHAA